MYPKRIQRRRTKGWRVPANAKSVARPSRWGNPFKISPAELLASGHDLKEQARRGGPNKLTRDEANAGWIPYARAMVVRKFRTYALERMMEEPEWLAPLRGKDLACYCKPDEACHADVLIELANSPSQ